MEPTVISQQALTCPHPELYARWVVYEETNSYFEGGGYLELNSDKDFDCLSHVLEIPADTYDEAVKALSTIDWEGVA